MDLREEVAAFGITEDEVSKGTPRKLVDAPRLEPVETLESLAVLYFAFRAKADAAFTSADGAQNTGAALQASLTAEAFRKLAALQSTDDAVASMRNMRNQGRLSSIQDVIKSNSPSPSL